MKCSDIRSELALYADNVLDPRQASAVSTHLDGCPVCRERLTQLHDLRSAMRRIRRPEITAALRSQIKRDIGDEIRTRETTWLPVSAGLRAWLRFRVMPYAVGAVASVTIGLTVLTLMFTRISDQNGATAPRLDDSVLLASNRDPLFDRDAISPTDYARTRLDVSSESPSINPRGALVALTRSLVRGRIKDDEVVVVADVFGNGLARISEVVEPSRDQQAMAELEKALASNDPQYAPFVSAGLDKRSETMRVVFRFQNVDVPTSRRPRR